MSYVSESYIEKPYLPRPSSIATFLICGTLLNSGVMAILGNEMVDEKKSYLNELPLKHDHHEVYNFSPPTWLDTARSKNVNDSIDGNGIRVQDSLKMVHDLAFIEVDEEIDRRIENYFSSKTIKTRTIFKNHRIKKG